MSAEQPLPLDQGNAERTGRPPRDKADDGKTGGRSQGGRIGSGAIGNGAGVNAQNGKASGSETEREAPGVSTDKKADDTK